MHVLGIGGGSYVSCVQSSKCVTFFLLVACCTPLPPLCFCVQSSKHITFFFVCCVLHPTPPLCFLCMQLQTCNVCFLLHVAPHPFLYVFGIHNFKRTMLFCFVASCTPRPPSSLFFVSRAPNV